MDRSRRILVVDNSPTILMAVGDFLRQEGFTVKTAADGLSALDALEAYTPDIFIVDLVMPNIDGRKLCQIIRRIDAFKWSQIIILSAIAAEEDLDVRELGANACVAKGSMEMMKDNILSVICRLDGSPDRFEAGTVGLGSIVPRGTTKELLSVKRHFEHLLETVVEGVLEITEEGRILYANTTASDLLDAPEDRLLGSRITARFEGENRIAVTEALDELAKGNGAAPQDRHVQRDRYQLVLKMARLDHDRNTALVILNDVTEAKQAEESLVRERDKLKAAVEKVKLLSGLLPICSHCKKIRDDKGYWDQIENYIYRHSEAEFSHGICPDCAKEHFPDINLYD